MENKHSQGYSVFTLESRLLIAVVILISLETWKGLMIRTMTLS